MRNNFKGMLLMIAALGLWGCTDKLTDNISEPEDIGGETGYVSFRIKSADTGGMTRAVGDAWNDDDNVGGDYGYGSDADGDYAAEDAIVKNIQANRAFFFKKDGTYHSSSLLNLTETVEKHPEKGDDYEHGTTYAEQVYSATVKRTGERGDQYEWPSQCLVVLNGRPSRLNALLAKVQADPKFGLNDFLQWVNEDYKDTDVTGEGLTLGLYKYNDKNYFTMTNSVFLDKQDKVTTTTTFDPDTQMYPTSAQAEEHPITVYVERIMAKVEVGFSNPKDGEEESVIQYFGGQDGPSYIVYNFSNMTETESKWLEGDGAMTADEAAEKSQPIILKALVTNWSLNAVEYQTKLFKDITFGEKPTPGTDASTENTESNKPKIPSMYDGITWDDEKPFEGWNDYNHHRSYWATDKHYKWIENEYPTQYRRIYDGKTGRAYQPEEDWQYGQETGEYDHSDTESGNDILNPNTPYPWALDYKSYNAISNRRRYKYCLENTFEVKDNTNKEGYKYMIMGSHLLVQARLITADEETAIGTVGSADDIEKKLDEKVKDKYYYDERYYEEETYIRRQVAVIKEALSEKVEGYKVRNVKMWTEDADAGADADEFDLPDAVGGDLYIKDDTDTENPYKKITVNKTANKEKNEVLATDVFTIAPAYIAKGDGKVTIALGTQGNDGKYHYGYDDEEVNLYYKKIVKNAEEEDEEVYVPFTRNLIVSIIYQVANIADCFKNGRMYYAVPVQHYLAQGNGNDYKYVYEKVTTGDYGIVRNHWYKFVINQIAKPGIPVHDPDQPIIPNYDEEDRYIGLEVIILPWHIVDNGNVTLGQ